MHKHRFSLVACARWEEAHIVEWVEYHRSIGFDHVYLYSNDDDPTALFRAVAPYTYGDEPFVTFRHWPKIGQQIEIYLHWMDTFQNETEWFSFLDIDEFITIRHAHDIETLMRDYEADTDCLYLNWVIYGHNGKLRREDGPVLTSYLRRARGPDPHTKMICRSAAVDPAAVRQGSAFGRGSFWHFLDNYQIEGLRCRDVLHRPMDGYSAAFPETTKPFLEAEGHGASVLALGYVAHFQFKSEEDFIRRWRRGGFPNGEQWRSAYETGAHRSILALTNVVYDTWLAEHWVRYTAAAQAWSVNPPDEARPYANVALNKPSWQSSVFDTPGVDEPQPSRLTGAGNNGVLTGNYGFHTRREARPWWIVDLLSPHRLTELRIYNREGDRAIAARSAALDVMASLDGAIWTILLARDDAEPFGGKTQGPLIVKPAGAAAFRFVMLRLRTTECLHLDEVEVYGISAG